MNFVLLISYMIADLNTGVQFEKLTWPLLFVSNVYVFAFNK